MRPVVRPRFRFPAALAAASLFATALGLAAPAALAERFIPIGARQRALGSAGVAATEDATAIYWNPANLALLPLNRAPYALERKREVERSVREGRDAAEGLPPPPDGDFPPDEGPYGDEIESRGKWEGYDTFQFQIVAGAELKLTGDVVSRLDRLDQLIDESDIPGAIQRASATPPQLNQQDFRNLVRLFDEVEGLDEGGDALAELGGGIFFRYKGFGIAAYNETYVGLVPTVTLASQVSFSDAATIDAIDAAIDPGNTIPPPATAAGQQFQSELVAVGISSGTAADIARLAEEAGVDLNDPDLRDALRIAALTSGTAGAGGIEDNPSGAIAKTLTTQELALSIAFEAFDELIAIGVTPKLMYGITAFKSTRVSDVVLGNEDFESVSREFYDSRETTLQFGIDVGAAIQPTRWLRLGVVGRNLNTPRFDVRFGDDVKLHPQWRAGVAVRPLRSLLLTADIDLTRNTSDVLPGFSSQIIGGGVEWNPDWRSFGFALRAGCYGDLEDERDGSRPVLTAGLGFKFSIVTIDAGIAFSLRRDDFRDEEIPEDLGVALNLGMSW